jgi:vacuolar-type H+-ATPase subunit I/STV1
MAENFRGKAEEMLAELGRKVDQLIHESRGASEEIREEIEERIAELKRNKEQLENEVHNFSKNRDPKWKAVEEKLGRAVDEVREAIRIAFGKNKEQ